MIMLYAIAACVSVGSTKYYCHLVGRPFVFQSEEQCVQAMATRLGPGNLVGSKFYHIGNGSGKVWYECEHEPVAQWQP